MELKQFVWVKLMKKIALKVVNLNGRNGIGLEIVKMKKTIKSHLNNYSRSNYEEFDTKYKKILASNNFAVT